MNPLLGTDAASTEMQSLIFSCLVKVNNKLEILPDLAEKWQIKDNGKKYIFYLHSGVKWHDGKEFTAQDVKFTFDKILEPKTACDFAGDFQNVSSVRVLDQNSVEFNLQEPDASFLARLTAAYIIPEHLLKQVENLRECQFNQTPIGTGPFKFVERKAAEYIKFTCNNNYFGARAKLEEFYYKVVPDGNVLAMQLKKGEIDVAQIDPRDYQTLQTDSQIKLITMPGQAYTFIALNNRLSLFADSRVRQALALGHNRQKVIDNILAGHAYLARADLPPQSWGYDENLQPLIYNPEKARELLAEAGWKKNTKGILEKNGQPFSFTLLVRSNNQKVQDLALTFQQDLKDLGIEVKILPLEFNVLRQKHLFTYDFQACIMSQRLGPDPDGRYLAWHSSQGKGGLNFSGLNNSKIDQLLEAGRRIVEQEKRKPIYQEIQQILLAEQPFIFHNYPELIIGARKNVSGISEKGMGAEDNIFWNITEWEKK